MKWLETHKHLAIVIVVLLALLFLTCKLVAHFDGVAHDDFVLKREALKQTEQHNVELAAAQVDFATKYTALSQQVAADRKRYDAENAALRNQLADRQQKDNQLAPPELATRWEQIIGAQPGSVQSQPDGLLASLPTAHATVSLLEEVETCHGTNDNQLKIIHDLDLKADKCQQYVDTILLPRIDGLVAESKQKTETFEAEKKDMKKQARKAKIKAYIAGAGTVLIFVGKKLLGL